MKYFTLVDKAFFLKKTPLFGSLDLDLLLAIADKMNVVQFKEGETIFEDREEGFRMYFIVKGEVGVSKSQTPLMEKEFFGEEALFNEKPRAYKAIARKETTLMALSKTHLLTIISECPSVALGFLQVYTASVSIGASSG
jgi:CRP-like cAMP-binding protein